jgi:hypothetical protein
LKIKRRQQQSQDASMDPLQLACGGNQHDQSAIQPHLGALHQRDVGAESRERKKREALHKKQRQQVSALICFLMANAGGKRSTPMKVPIN